MRRAPWAIIARSLLLAPACVHDDCSGPAVLIDGEPSALTFKPGTQSEGYVVDAPVICSDGIGSIAIHGTGSQELTTYAQVEGFYQQVRATLGAQGVSTHGGGRGYGGGGRYLSAPTAPNPPPTCTTCSSSIGRRPTLRSRRLGPSSCKET